LCVYDEDALGSPNPIPELQVINAGLVQPLGDAGLAKAGAHIDGADVSPGFPVVRRYFNHLPGGNPVTVSYIGTGTYEVDFGANVSQRFYLATPGDDFASGAPAVVVECTPRGGNSNALYVVTRSVTTGFAADGEFFVFVL